jgi:hypothetical protein
MREVQVLRQESGAVPGEPDTTLVMAIQPTRADIALTPVLRSPNSAPKTLGNLKDALTKLQNYFLNWLGDWNSITRLAIGATILVPTKTEAESRDILFSKIQSFSAGGDIVEFGLQINRPRLSKTIGQLRINRLTNWQTVQYYAMGITNQGQALASPFPSLAAQCIIDVNTPQATLPLSPTLIKQLLSEMADMTIEIAAKGDVS